MICAVFIEIQNFNAQFRCFKSDFHSFLWPFFIRLFRKNVLMCHLFDYLIQLNASIPSVYDTLFITEFRSFHVCLQPWPIIDFLITYIYLSNLPVKELIILLINIQYKNKKIPNKESIGFTNPHLFTVKYFPVLWTVLKNIK